MGGDWDVGPDDDGEHRSPFITGQKEDNPE